MRNIHILAIPCNSQSFFLCAFTFSADFSALVKILKLEVRAHVFPEELCAAVDAIHEQYRSPTTTLANKALLLAAPWVDSADECATVA